MSHFGPSMTEALTNHLFEVPGANHSGLDLAALNIQRGRDHGIPGYVRYMEKCARLYGGGGPRRRDVRGFRDLATVMDKDRIRRLQSVYK